MPQSLGAPSTAIVTPLAGAAIRAKATTATAATPTRATFVPILPTSLSLSVPGLSAQAETPNEKRLASTIEEA
jgi:hypothetical protein